MSATLAELAKLCHAEIRGDATLRVDRVATLEAAGKHDIAFVAGEKHSAKLANSSAGAVILTDKDAVHFQGNALICNNPRLCLAKVAAFLHPPTPVAPGRHASAIVSNRALIGTDVAIGPQSVIEADVEIGDGAVIGPGCHIAAGAKIGAGSRLYAHVSIGERCNLGKRCIVQPGAVIGSDGFGYARDGSQWQKILQLGRVVIGDDVEIGANTTIDRGAIDDTVIERGVKLDNLIHVAHNVHIGADTAIAACVGIAGSTRIGRRCTIAGQVGIVGHIEITDDVHITGATVVSHSIRQPGTYSSGSPLEPYQSWLKNAVRMRQLDDMARRLKKLEQKLISFSEGGKVE